MASCAAFEPTPVSEKELGIPSELADKFSVKEAGDLLPPAGPVVEEVTTKTLSKAVAAKTKASKGSAVKSGEKVKREVWPNRWKMKAPFRSGDRVLLDITFFGATAGTLEMTVLPNKIVDDRTAYHVRAVAETSSIFSLFYRLYDVAETFIDQTTIVPIKFTLKMDESRQQREVVELYDHEKGKMHFWSKWDHVKRGKRLDKYELDIEEFAQDSISSFFYMRTLPLKPGDKYRFWVSTNGKMRDVQLSVVRREKLETRAGTFDTIVVKPEVMLDGVLQKKGDTFVWLSDDENRSILKIDAKIKVGSLVAYLREIDIGGVPVGDRRERN